MSLLGEFERRLERAVEGFFARVFRSGVHPVEIGKRLLRVMEEGKTGTLRQTFAPNVYRITLSQTDYARLAPLEAKLVEELEVFVSEAAERNSWTLASPPRVSFASGVRLSPGEFRIEAQPVAIPTARETRAGLGGPAAPTMALGAPMLEVDDGRTIGVGSTLRIGRLADNDLVLDDPRVSRHHAQIYAQSPGSFAVRDLGSTNKTFVNGEELAHERTLHDGDRIVVGTTVIHFRVHGRGH